MSIRIYFFFFFLINPFFFLVSTEKPYVTCWLTSGQLGNQLFQVATTLAYAWDNDVEAIFFELNYSGLNIPINRERVFFRLNASSLPRPIQHTFVQLRNYEKIELPALPDLYLKGYFQTEKYFDHHRQKILDIFAPRPKELSEIQSKYASLLAHPLTVGVHVRTFNKEWSPIIPFVGLDYYEKAFNLFPPQARFVVFSDRINWCKHHFQKFNRNMVFIEDGDHVSDLFLMSMLKHNIIANSTFSWWAAYLNRNPNKVIVAPSHFVHPTVLSQVNSNLPEWTTIDIDYDYTIAPYPEDIYNYDLSSKSIDTQ